MMGAGASVKRSASSMQAEIERLRKRELDLKEETVREWDRDEAKVAAEISQLQSERNDLAQRLAKMEVSFVNQKEGWDRERNKTLALKYSSLPLSLFSEEDVDFGGSPSLSVAKSFPMVTIAQSDVVGFSSITSRLKPQQVIRIIDHLHALMDEAYSGYKEIFIMERNSDGCTAVSGLVESLLEEKCTREGSISSLSLADSSYGSEYDILDHGREENKVSKQRQDKEATIHGNMKTASHFANILATSVLNLMSASSKINIPFEGQKQLQLRIAMHSGPCSAGILGLQTAQGSSRIPQFKLLGGTTVRHVNNLCRSGLALQIRVSKQCKDLLLCSGEFLFERCPDYTGGTSLKPIESYWLVGKTGLQIKLPSLDLAISLSDYDDLEII